MHWLAVGIYMTPVVTIYGPGPGGSLAVVSERRRIELPRAGDVTLLDVPAALLPATVGVVDLTDPGGTVISQQTFLGEVVGLDGLLARATGRPVTVLTDSGEARGVLRSWDPEQIVIAEEENGALRVVPRGPHLRDVRVTGVPTRPALVWTLQARKPGAHDLELTYQTKGLAWSAEYSVTLSADEKRFDLRGWVTLTDHAGGRFADATVRLVAGDVPRTAAAAGDEGLPVRPGKPFRVTLGRHATLEDNADQQVELVSATGLTAARRLAVLEHQPRADASSGPQLEQAADPGDRAPAPLDLVAEIPNTAAAGLGVALPPGVVHVYRRGADGPPELVEEDVLPATAKGDPVRLRLGPATGVTAQRRQVNFQVDESAHEMREKLEIEVRNGRKEAVDVEVAEHLWRWTTAQVEAPSAAAAVTDGVVRFSLRVPAGGAQTVGYTVLYTW